MSNAVVDEAAALVDSLYHSAEAECRRITAALAELEQQHQRLLAAQRHAYEKRNRLLAARAIRRVGT